VREVRQFATAAEVAKAAAGIFVRICRRAIEERGKSFVALAGGTTPLATYRVIAASRSFLEGEWEKIHVFFGDERCVAAASPDRNDRAAREALLDHVPIPPKNIHFVPVERPDAVQKYEAEIRAALLSSSEEIPRFDLVLLGMGPDGHTASLFPGHSSLEEKKKLVVRVDDSPKPPPSRITFTLPLINAARQVLFLVTGKDKAAALAAVLEGDVRLPSARVNPAPGSLRVLADEAALSLSKNAAHGAARGNS
jgi:6-phosphogluconolactonase